MPSSVHATPEQVISLEMLESVEQQLTQLLVSNAHAKRRLASQLQENLPPAAVPVLGMALREDQISQSEIGELLMVDKASLSRLVTRLEDAGLLVRTLDPHDRRVSRISATEQARKRWGEIMDEQRALWISKMRGWPNEDLRRLVALLGRLNEDLRQG